jgi:hypothetical protein
MLSSVDKSISVYLKRSHIAWESRLRIIYIQHSYILIHCGVFYKGKNCKVSHKLKADNTLKCGVMHLKVERNIGAKRRG